MKAPAQLTQARLMELLEYDPDAGLFVWRLRVASRVPKGTVAGKIDGRGYVQIKIDGVGYLAHRLVWLYMHGRWPEFEIDHINRIRTDNRASNLRDVTRSENQKNRTPGCQRRTKGKKYAQLNLGVFDTAVERDVVVTKARAILIAAGFDVK